MTPSRRDLLSLAASAPVAAALRSFTAQAQSGSIPKRVVLFFTPHGTVWNRWRPTVANGDFTLQGILAPLAPFKRKLVVLDGVGLPSDGPGAPHTRGPAVLFTGSPLADDGTFKRDDCSGGCSFGWNTSLSVDQEIANRLGNLTPYRSLEFSVASGGGFPGAFISYQAAAQPMVPRSDPLRAWDALFASRLQSDADRRKKLNRRLDVLGAVQGDLSALETRVSRADLVRLQAHADSLSDIQRTLQASVAQCVVPAKAAAKATGEVDYRAWAIDRQSELLAASLACGLTRVGSLQFRVGENDGGNSGIYGWLGQSSEHHLATHDTSAPKQQQISDIYTWYARSFAYLLQQLDSYPEADGTLLDHTLVVWGTEIGVGNTHDISNIPFVLAGGGKRGIKTGQYLKVPPTMNHRLLVSLLHYMGFTDAMKFGSVDRGSGPLSGLFT